MVFDVVDKRAKRAMSHVKDNVHSSHCSRSIQNLLETPVVPTSFLIQKGSTSCTPSLSLFLCHDWQHFQFMRNGCRERVRSLSDMAE